MSDSSTEEKSDAPVEAEVQKESKQVPVEAVAKERAEKRAARAEVAELKQAAEQQGTIDDALIEQLAVQAKAAVDQELQPEREARAKAEHENSLLRLRLDHGLDDSQAEIAMDFQAKNPNLSIEQSLMLARMEKPDAFPAGDLGRPSPVGMPVSGDSPLRTGANKEDHLKKMNDARASGDWQGARVHAAMEFQRRFQGLRNMAPRN